MDCRTAAWLAVLWIHSANGYQRQQSSISSKAGLEPQRLQPYRQVMHNYKFLDMQYTADVAIGNQLLNGVLDTGSFELLVFSKDCKVCGDTVSLYNSSESTTYQKGPLETVHVFGSGPAWSTEAFERVVVGPLVAPNVSFWEVYNADFGKLLEHSDFQAIVGVGPPGVPEAEADMKADHAQAKADWWDYKVVKPLKENAPFIPVPNPLQPAANKQERERQYVLTRNYSLLEIFNTQQFSVCLSRPMGSNGYFIWNDNAAKMHPNYFQQVPVIGKYTWSAQLENIRLMDPEAVLASKSEGSDGFIRIDQAPSYAAIVDSGTSLLVMPTAVALNISAAMDRININCGKVLLHPELLPQLHFTLGGKSFVLPPEAFLGSFVQPVPQKPHSWFRAGVVRMKCGLELLVMTEDAETQYGPLWILGMPFFKQYYTTFDLGTNSDGENDNRALHIAKASAEGCVPSRGIKAYQSVDPFGETQSIATTDRAATQRWLRKVHISQLRIPRWASKVFAKRRLRI